MKKVALVLGSLLVSLSIQAAEIVGSKEVVPPVEKTTTEPVVETTTTPVVAPAPIAMTTSSGFTPTGYVGVEYRYYGETEGHGDDIKKDSFGLPADSQDHWNRGSNNYGRLETTFGVQATDKFSLEGRIRNYADWDSGDDRVNNTDGTETRLRFYYKHNDWFTSRLQYRYEEDDSQNIEYQARFKVYENEGALLSGLTIAPKFYHTFAKDNGSDYLNMFGANVEYAGNLPLGVTYDGTLYFEEYLYNKDQFDGKDKKFKDEFQFAWEFYLYKSFDLYEGEKAKTKLNLEGGYDPYVITQYKRYARENGNYVDKGRSSYSLYGSANVSVDYKLTDNVTAKAGVGAEYRNWDVTNAKDAKDWRWQPYTFAGMKVTF